MSSWFLVILFLSLKLSITLSEAINHDDNKKILPSAFVVGTIYCDTCFQQTFSKESHFVSGASIAVKCKLRNSKSGFYTEVKTNEHGEFKVKLPFLVKKHVKRIKMCSFKLLSSSEPHCAIASTTTSTTSLNLKKNIQGEHVFSAGFFSFKPMKKPSFCNQKPNFPNSKEHVYLKHSIPNSKKYVHVKPSIPNSKEHVYEKHSTQSSKKPHFSDQQDVSIFPPLIPNPFQPPPLIPNPFQPPPLIPNPFQPPSPPLIPNPFQPPSPPPFLPNPLQPPPSSPPPLIPNPFQPPPSSPPPLIPNPFQPPPSSPPPSFPFPPIVIPGITPSPPPPPPPPKSIFPPFPFPPLFPPPHSPGSPPTSSKNSSP